MGCEWPSCGGGRMAYVCFRCEGYVGGFMVALVLYLPRVRHWSSGTESGVVDGLWSSLRSKHLGVASDRSPPPVIIIPHLFTPHVPSPLPSPSPSKYTSAHHVLLRIRIRSPRIPRRDRRRPDDTRTNAGTTLRRAMARYRRRPREHGAGKDEHDRGVRDMRSNLE